MFNSEFWITWEKYFSKIIYPNIGATLRLLGSVMILSSFFGFIIAIALTMFNPRGIHPNKVIYKIMTFLINSICSFPMIIMIVAISPITKIVMGTTIGERAAIFPLTIVATPFIARTIENVFMGVDKQIIEAARSFGASDIQIIFKVILKESVPSLISSLVLSTISYLGATAVAGAVGAGGLGAVALNYGYQSFNNLVLYTAVAVLFFIVLVIRTIGNWIYKISLK